MDYLHRKGVNMSEVTAMSDVTAHFVADALGLTGPDLSLTATPVGAGQVARCFRLELSSGGVPLGSVIAKTPSDDNASRATAALQHLYVRETRFYDELAPSVAIRTPRCYLNQSDADDNFLLLLEDFSPVTGADQFSGLSVEQARIGLRELAGLHGPTMHRSEIHEAAWLGGVSNELAPIYSSILPGLFSDFLLRYSDAISAESRQIIAELGDKLSLYSGYETPHRCVVHGDFRSDNLLFHASGGAVPLAVVDWQTVSTGSPMLDVAYFLTTSLLPEDRRAHEEELLNFYLDELRQYQQSFRVEQMQREYRRYTLQPIVMLVAASVIVERTERGDRMFLTMIDRGVQAATHWHAIEELG